MRLLMSYYKLINLNDKFAIEPISICDWTNILPTFYIQRNAHFVNLQSIHYLALIIERIITIEKYYIGFI